MCLSSVVLEIVVSLPVSNQDEKINQEAQDEELETVSKKSNKMYKREEIVALLR